MGHSTASGRTASFSREADEAAKRGDFAAYNRAMDEADRTRFMSARERQEAANAAARRDAERLSAIDRRNKAIDDAKFQKERGAQTLRSFSIPGIGGANVMRSATGYTAMVWAANEDPAYINGGRAFQTRQEAEKTAKQYLKGRLDARSRR